MQHSQFSNPPKYTLFATTPPPLPRQCCTNYCFQMLLSFKCCAKCSQKNSPETILNWCLKMPTHLVPVQTTTVVTYPHLSRLESSDQSGPHHTYLTMSLASISRIRLKVYKYLVIKTQCLTAVLTKVIRVSYGRLIGVNLETS